MSYSSCLIAYIDVLGFKALIRDRPFPEIERILEDLQDFRSRYENPAGNERFRSESFSDHVVRAFKLGTQTSTDVYDEICEIGFKQAGLLASREDGVLIRGGICRGEFSFDTPTFVFGRGLTKAYELESNFSIYPRVVLDHELVQDSALECRDFVTRGDDGTFFIDYLFGNFMADFLLEKTSLFSCGILRRHLDVFLARSETFLAPNRQLDVRIKQKILWMGLYHNRVLDRILDRLVPVDEFQSLRTVVNDLRIPSGSLQF